MSWKQKAKLENRCTNCGASKTRTGNLCADCAAKHRKRNNKYIQEVRRKKPGLCFYCGKKADQKQCPQCKEKSREYKKARRESFKLSGKCLSCGEERVQMSSLCLRHFMQQQSDSAFGTTKNWELLLKKFEGQHKKCYYSGIELLIGVNASIDHKIPQSKHGSIEGVYSTENIVWCDKWVNIMKNGLTDVEFMGFCKIIFQNFNEPVELASIEAAWRQEVVDK